MREKEASKYVRYAPFWILKSCISDDFTPLLLKRKMMINWMSCDFWVSSWVNEGLELWHQSFPRNVAKQNTDYWGCSACTKKVCKHGWNKHVMSFSWPLGKKGWFLLLCALLRWPPPLLSTDRQRRGLSKAHFWPLKICGSRRCFKSGLGNTASTALPTYTMEWISVKKWLWNSLYFRRENSKFRYTMGWNQVWQIVEWFLPSVFVVVARRVLKGSSSNAAVQLP